MTVVDQKICNSTYECDTVKDYEAVYGKRPFIYYVQYILYRECASTGAAGARTRRCLGHHLLHPLILRGLVLCAPAVLRPRALQDASAPADPQCMYVCMEYLFSSFAHD